MFATIAHRHGMLGVGDDEVQEDAHMRIIQRIEHAATAAPSRHDPMGAQQLERVRGRGIRLPGDGGKIMDAQLTGQERHHQSQPMRLPEQGEHIGGIEERRVRGHPAQDRADSIGVDAVLAVSLPTTDTSLSFFPDDLEGLDI